VAIYTWALAHLTDFLGDPEVEKINEKN